MKIYTRKGDEGSTHLIGKRVTKTNARVEAYGMIDEMNSFLGLALSYLTDDIYNDLRADLTKIQHELFDLGGDLANVSEKLDWALKEEYVSYLENRIDEYWEEAPALKNFILPGGEKGAAYLHVCRTVTRRAERQALKISDQHPLPPAALKYINRLSDYFFAAARVVNHRAGKADIPYERSKDVFQ
ncbi:cob(I)alamin adenosyltransferase [Evansella caseinilytica]|uniref:Corrinoid adenosyltransferase n=1 Tax=Evansella caseinilytica TaxID=1503961 RepID=A0A1H3L9Q4_9BACI|nr:cob(I)yrinic acid a,c-diamide adenosyltransferase [Evansella caseinilytica]SDY61016.1 cob(I)alamin adenosyltransferase [Evansella caseinilytica]